MCVCVCIGDDRCSAGDTDSANGSGEARDSCNRPADAESPPSVSSLPSSPLDASASHPEAHAPRQTRQSRKLPTWSALTEPCPRHPTILTATHVAPSAKSEETACKLVRKSTPAPRSMLPRLRARREADSHLQRPQPGCPEHSKLTPDHRISRARCTKKKPPGKGTGATVACSRPATSLAAANGSSTTRILQADPTGI